MGLDGTAVHAIWAVALLVGGGTFATTFVDELDEARVATEDRQERDKLALQSSFEVVQASLDYDAGTVMLQLVNTGRSQLDPALVTVLFDGTPRAVSGVETGGTGGSRVWTPDTHANLTVVSEWAPRRVAVTESFGHTRTWDNPEPPYFVAVTVSPDPADVEFLDTQQFTASGYDQYGEPTTTASVAWTTDVVDSSIDGDTGLFTAGTTEDCGSVTATSNSVADSATVCVYREPAVLTALAVAPDPASVEFLATQQFTATCTDQYALSMTCPTLTWATDVSGSSVDASGLFTAGTTEGTGSVAAENGAVNDAAAVTVYRNAAVLTAIALAPATASVEFLDTQQFTAACTDQYALSMTCPSLAWATDVSGSSVSATGLFTAGTTVDAGVVTATSGGVVGTADVDVWRDAAVLTDIVVAPDPASVEFLATQQFTATCEDQYGVTMSCPSLTWSQTVSDSSISGTGLFTAGTTEDTGSATAENGAVSGSAAVTVYRDAAVLTSLSLSPTSATVQATKSATFTPACVDQYDLTMTCPSLTWSTTVSGASVSAGGVFTAGTTLGSGTVRAENGAVFDTSDVTVSSLVVYIDYIKHYKGSTEQYSFHKSSDTVTTKILLRAVVDGAAVPNVAVTTVTKDAASATRNTANANTDSSGIATTSYNLPASPTGTWKVQATSVSAAWITYQGSSNTSPFDSPLPAERTYEVT
ncbi:MAG TPA: hypothetical protein VI997_11345 [Candidatus Thermoplasmatota archaeon]|nr:hypothetical protein [Candidatus Thermoplasmatota archaeon]